MKIDCPVLNVNEEASELRIREIIRELEGKEVDPFAILGANDLEYIQTLWTENGFILEFQEGTTNEHFEVMEYLSTPKVQSIFISYLNGDVSWRDSYPIKKRNLNGLSYKLGHTLGYLFGRFKRGLEEGRNK